jgi:hypothetical protein
MFNLLNCKIADRIIGTLSGTGSEGRVRKVVARYRKYPNDTVAVEAVELLNALDESKLIELKQAARV